jgi:hypothetical protein
MRRQPTIASKPSRDALLEIGPSTGLRGGDFGKVYVEGKGLYVWKSGDQSSNVPGGNGSDAWVAPSEDTSGKSGAWKRLQPESPTGVDGNVVTGTAGTSGDLAEWNSDGDLVDGPSKTGADDNVVTGTAGTNGNLLEWNGDGDAIDSGLATSDVQTGLPSTEGAFDATNGGSNDLTEIPFTGLASGANRISVMLDSLSLSGSDDAIVQIGDSGGYETSGYTSATLDSAGNNSSAAGFIIELGGDSRDASGRALVMERISGNTWVCSIHFARAGSGGISGGGRKQLSAELDRLRIVASGSNTFDGGAVNVRVET